MARREKRTYPLIAKENHSPDAPQLRRTKLLQRAVHQQAALAVPAEHDGRRAALRDRGADLVCHGADAGVQAREEVPQRACAVADALRGDDVVAEVFTEGV